MATHSSVLAWRIPWREEPGGLQSMGSQRVLHNWSNLAFKHAPWHYRCPQSDQRWKWISYHQPFPGRTRRKSSFPRLSQKNSYDGEKRPGESVVTGFQHALPFLNHKVTQLSGSLCTSENKVAVMSEWPAFQTDVEDQIKPPQTLAVSRSLGQLQKHGWPLVLRDLTG